MNKYCIKEDGEGKILLIYTGGTLGMNHDPISGTLSPLDFSSTLERIPELKLLPYKIDLIAFSTPIDSSNIQISHWQEIAKAIADYYTNYDAFVVLHGTDTMAYTASALSFMLQGLNKAVVLTGSQLPIGIPRSDARENVLSSIEIAMAKKDGVPIFTEVIICFNAQVLRGNRAKKVESSLFAAFHSENYPVLAEIGVKIEYNFPYIQSFKNKELSVHFELDNAVSILKLQPGIDRNQLEHFFKMPNIKAVILETYGAGNAPNYSWFVDVIAEAIDSGIIVLNVSQCTGGAVKQSLYDSGLHLEKAGVLSGFDISTEAAVAKLMYLLSFNDTSVLKSGLNRSISGEISINS